MTLESSTVRPANDTLETSVNGSFDEHAHRLAEFLSANAPVLALTGAGISTASGIPAYRDEAGNWQHAKPVQYADFMNKPDVYQRYWARSSIGWPTMRNAKPNDTHRALAALERLGLVSHLITQNVDALHDKAQHRNLICLHGDLRTVACQQCESPITRDHLQQRMLEDNRSWFTRAPTLSTITKPDGDALLAPDAWTDFRAPMCIDCGGLLKPDVVFFGESIPRTTIDKVLDAQQRANALLVVGSSLVVFSGFRIVRDFCAADKPVAIVNKGVTRADELVAQRHSFDAGTLLDAAIKRLPASALDPLGKTP